ncbi:MAG: ATP-binding cassette domain-containing protein [Myxococcaceae bacterium]|nr:ATP-binding cassette domain-containing protein [Myxococcaceae bacterium]
MLRFTQVVKRFEPGTPPVLDGLDAEVPLKGLTFVIGKSGSGKSVLCRLAVGLLKPDEGTVTLDGERVDELPERSLRPLRARVPYLVQGPALIDWVSVVENVMLAAKGAKAARRAAALDALKRVGLFELADRFPPQLGPGVKKRAAIARALVLEPTYLLLDEPTTGLDREAAGQVNETLLELKRQGLGAMIVSHDHRAMNSMADRVLEVSAGKAKWTNRSSS